MLLSLLLLIALAVLSLSNSETVKSSHTSAELIARANAQMALQIAIAQLQLHTGPDQTVSCRADLLDSRDSPLAYGDPKILHPHYTLAFQTAPVDEDYNHTKYGNGVFLRQANKLPAYLVSGNESYDTLGSSSLEYAEGYTTARTPLEKERSVILLHSKNPLDEVRVPTVSINTATSNQGTYAYWVSDENTKARINLERNGDTKTDSLSKFNQLRAPAALGIQAAGSKNTEGFLETVEAPSKHFTPSTVGIHGKKAQLGMRQHRHDLTTYSQSVLCDLKHGGLKKNLTAALNLDDKEFAKLTEHTASNASTLTPVFLFKKWSFPAEVSKLSYSHYPGVPWELFRSYSRRPEFEPNLTGNRPVSLSHLGSAAHKLPNYWQSKAKGVKYTHPLDARLIRRSPTLLRFQVGIDYSIGYLGTVVDDELGGACHEFELRQHFTPTASYWNPYNVDLEVAEKIEYHIYLDRNWSSGRHNTHFRLHMNSDIPWRIQGLFSDSKKEKKSWSNPLTGNSDFYYPFHPSGNTPSQSTLSRCSFQVPPFRLDAGKTALFSSGSNNKKLRFSKTNSNTLKRMVSSTQSGHSFYTNNSRFRILAAELPDYRDAVPLLEILSFPSSEGKSRTRLHVTNASSFQRINWNFSDITRNGGISFLPTLTTSDEPLPQSDSNGTESPKISAVVIRKFPDIEHYLTQPDLWKTQSGTNDSNPYSVPWSIFYQNNATRYAAYGAKASHEDSFTSPPQYLAGILLGVNSILQPDLTPSAESFVGYSDRSANGSTEAIQIALPRSETRVFSPAHLGQINTAKWLSNYNAQQSNASATDAISPSIAIGNSFSSPHIPPSASSVTVHDKHAYASSPTATQYDTSFRYNEALWDRYFFTGERADELLSTEGIINDRQASHLTPRAGIDLKTWNDPQRSASNLMLEGGFNVNSTSVEAWKILLASTIGQQATDPDNSAAKLTPFPRLQYSSGSGYSTPPEDPTNPDYYNGKLYRALTVAEIQSLAEQIVIQNKLRGPYTNLAQFINRSLSPEHHFRKSALGLALSTDDVCYEGAIQTAINKAKINGVFHTNNAQFPLALAADENALTDYEAGKINPKAFKYHTGYGAPGTLTQADILNSIGYRLTARSDTFIIRAYGDSRDSKGNILSKAYCEAVVQRFPEYINSNDPSETPPQLWKLAPNDELQNKGSSSPNSNLSTLSTQLGRRYRIVQFRWLSPKQI